MCLFILNYILCFAVCFETSGSRVKPQPLTHERSMQSYNSLSGLSKKSPTVEDSSAASVFRDTIGSAIVLYTVPMRATWCRSDSTPGCFILQSPRGLLVLDCCTDHLFFWIVPSPAWSSRRPWDLLRLNAAASFGGQLSSRTIHSMLRCFLAVAEPEILETRGKS